MKNESSEKSVLNNKKYWYFIFGIGLCGLLWLFYAAARPHSESMPSNVTHNFNVMGTMAAVGFQGDNLVQLNAAVTLVENQFKNIEQLYSLYDPQSELSRLNQTAQKEEFICSEEMWQMLLLARKAYKLSDGNFDVTIKPLMDLWGFYRKNNKGMPSVEEIMQARNLVGLDKVIFDDNKKSVRFTQTGMCIDFGGIAKGAAVGLAADKLRLQNINCGVINLGGNICFLPEMLNPEQRSYNVGIRDPFDLDKVAAILPLKNCTVATSGNYEKFVTINNKRYAHIINPKTGYPVEGVLSVTVITPLAENSDWLSTSAFVGNKELAEKLVEAIPGTAFVFVFPDENFPNKMRLDSVGKLPDETKILIK